MSPRERSSFPLHDDPQWGCGHVRDWLVCGPFIFGMADDGEGRSPFEEDYLVSVGGEKKARPYRGMKVRHRGEDTTWQKTGSTWSTHLSHSAPVRIPEERVWKETHSTGLALDYCKELGEKSFDGCWMCFYAATYIVSPRSADVHLWVGSTRGYTLWVNHEVAAELDVINRHFTPDAEVYRVRLRRGRNLVLCKVYGTFIGGAHSCLRVTATDGSRAGSLTVSLPAGGGTAATARDRAPRLSPRKDIVRDARLGTADTVLLGAAEFRGGLMNRHSIKGGEPGSYRVVYPVNTKRNRMEAQFDLGSKPGTDAVMLVKYISGGGGVRILVNGKQVHEGLMANRALVEAHEGHEPRCYVQSLIAGRRFLKAGRNRIALESCEDLGRVGSEPFFALRSVEIVLAEAHEHYEGWNVLRVAADRFTAEQSIVLGELGSTTNWFYLQYKRVVHAPARGSITARFVLQDVRRDDDRRRVSYVLGVFPLKMVWPWTRDDPENRGEKRAPAYVVRINGHEINAVEKEGGVNADHDQLFYAPLGLAVKPEFLKKGVNELVIETADTAVTARLHAQEIESFTLRERMLEDFEVTRCPRYVNAGENFYIKVRTLGPRRVDRVTCGPGVAYDGKLPLQLSAGEERIEFKAVAPGADTSIVLEAGRKKAACRLRRITDVADTSAVKHVTFACTESPSNSLISHTDAIEVVKDEEFSAGVHVRNRMREDTPVSFGRKVAALYVKSRLFLTYSWMPLHEGPRNRFSANDIRKWAGDRLYLGGTRREEPPVRRWKDLRDVKESYVRQLRKYYKSHPTCGCHVNQLWHRFACEAGCRNIWIQVGYSNSEIVLASLRGTARAYTIPFGASNCTDCALVYWDDPRYLRVAALNNFVTYISGADWFLPEHSSLWAMEGYLHPANRRYLDDPLTRKLFALERDFYDFLRTRKRGRGPVIRLGFVHGNLDGWDGWSAGRKPEFMEGHYAPGKSVWEVVPREETVLSGKIPYWPYGPPEAGWRYLQTVMPGVKFLKTTASAYPTGRRYWFCSTPFGKVDLVPHEAPLPKLQKYESLVFLGWNTTTPGQYHKLKRYVEGGGTLFMSVAHLSTQVDRDCDLQLLKEGDFEDLFGVRIGRRGAEVKEIACVTRTAHAGIRFPVKKRYRLAGHERNTVRLADLRGNVSGRVLAVDAATGKPVLVEKAVGRGTAYLLTLWNYPGEEKLGAFVEDLLRAIAAATQGDIKVEGSTTVNYAVYEADGIGAADRSAEGESLTHIHLADIDWWSMDKEYEECRLCLRGTRFPLRLPRAEIVTVSWFRDLAVVPANKMTYVQDIREEPDGTYRVIVQGAGRQCIELLLLQGKPERVRLNGRKVVFAYDGATRRVRCEVTLKGRDELEVRLVRAT